MEGRLDDRVPNLPLQVKMNCHDGLFICAGAGVLRAHRLPHWVVLVQPGAVFCYHHRLRDAIGPNIDDFGIRVHIVAKFQGASMGIHQKVLRLHWALCRNCQVSEGLTYPELQCWDNSLKGARDTWGGTEMPGFRANAGGAAFSQTEVLADVTDPLLSSPTTQPARIGRHQA